MLVGASAEVRPIDRPEDAEPEPPASSPAWRRRTSTCPASRPGGSTPAPGRAAYRLPGGGDRPGHGRADRRDRDPAPEQGRAARRGGSTTPATPKSWPSGAASRDHAMMLYVGPPAGDRTARASGSSTPRCTSPCGEVFDLLTIDSVREAIGLADRGLRPLTGGRPPRVAVAGLNPHAGENGLFGDEEATIIAPGRRRGAGPRGSTRPGRSPPTRSSPGPSAGSSTRWSRCTTTRGTSP